MAANLGGPQGCLGGGFLATYFALLLFCFSVFVSQGDVWLIAGLTSLVCCCVVFFGWFTGCNYRFHSKCLKDVSLDKERYSEGKGKVYAS
jgi:hypothetical protein